MCADLKVLAVLTGLQGGYTKFCCFLCDWDCQARDCHYRVNKMTTPFRNNTRSEECGTPCFNG